MSIGWTRFSQNSRTLLMSEWNHLTDLSNALNVDCGKLAPALIGVIECDG